MKANSLRVIRLFTAGLAAAGLAVSLAAINLAGAPRNALYQHALAQRDAD